MATENLVHRTLRRNAEDHYNDHQEGEEPFYVRLIAQSIFVTMLQK